MSKKKVGIPVATNFNELLRALIDQEEAMIDNLFPG